MTDLEQALRAAEDELLAARSFKTRTAAWINNPAYDRDARTALAETLGIPTPHDARKEPTPA